MMTLFVKLFIKNKNEVSNPNVKKAYAALSSVVGILLNLFLCIAKITVGFLVTLLPYQQMVLITWQMQELHLYHFWDLRLHMAVEIHTFLDMAGLNGS